MSQPQQGEVAQPKPSLIASYTSPTNKAFQIASQLDLSSSHPSAEEPPKQQQQQQQQRVAHLAQLRKAASAIQASVNKELTSRMDQDKAREAEAAASGPKNNKAAKIDYDAEEQNYGEEVVEDSD